MFANENCGYTSVKTCSNQPAHLGWHRINQFLPLCPENGQLELSCELLLYAHQQSIEEKNKRFSGNHALPLFQGQPTFQILAAPSAVEAQG